MGEENPEQIESWRKVSGRLQNEDNVERPVQSVETYGYREISKKLNES